MKYDHFKHLLEYFVSHLEYVSNNDENHVGFNTYIKPLIERDRFSKTGQGHKGQSIQAHIESWSKYDGVEICINIQAHPKAKKRYQTLRNYLNWKNTGVNVVAYWKNDRVTGLYLSNYLSKAEYKQSDIYSLDELGLFSAGITQKLEDFFNRYQNLYHSIHKKINDDMISNLTTLLRYKKQLILQGPPGTGKTRKAKYIAAEMLGLNQTDDLENHEQFALVQFHPSYSYEDFVEGLKPVLVDEKLSYQVKPGILKQMTKKAMKAYLKSDANAGEQNTFDSLFENFTQSLRDKQDRNPTVFTTKSGVEIYFHSYTGNFIQVIYKWSNRDEENEGSHIFKLSKHKFQQLIELQIDPANVKNLRSEIKPTVKFHQSEYYAVYKELYQFIQDHNVDMDAISTDEEDYNSICEAFLQIKAPEKIQGIAPFILVIDEINRANLSSVLGELIYALEYRGIIVNSMNNDDESSPLILPPNLFIIGTMNTADRSVGHIDYAIRRRFAFKEILPENLTTDTTVSFDSNLFSKVSALFDTNLSPDFRKEEVCLGHSYFIDKSDEGGSMEIRWEYEILPILMEYVKDGILVNKAGIENVAEHIRNLNYEN